jgi:O-antigen/teichoic acid export membrane protein
MSLIKKLAGQTAIYGLTTILTRFINFFLTPIHLSGALSMHEYGVVTSMYAFIAFLNVIFTYGMETAYFRFATKNEENAPKVYNNAVSSILFSSLIFGGLIFLFSQPIAEILGFREDSKIVQWVALVLATDAIVAIPFARLRLLKKVYLFAGAKLSNVVLNFFLNFFFLVVCPWVMNDGFMPSIKPIVETIYFPGQMVTYIFVANLLANVVYFPFLIPTFRGLNFKVDLGLFKEMFIYAFPIFLTGIPGMVNEMFSRIMLEKWLPDGFYPDKTSMEALGVFGACYKMGVFMTIAIQAFRFASEPFFFTNAKDKNAPELFARVMTYFIIATTFIFLFVMLNIDWLSSVIIRQESFKEALGIVPTLLLSGLFFGIYINLSVWYKLTDKTYWGTYITLGGAFITVLLNYLLIPVYGYQGSVWATFFAYFTMCITSYFLGQKYFPIPYQLNKGIGYLILGLGLFSIQNILESKNLSGFLINNFLLVVFVTVVFLVEKIKLNKTTPSF